MRTLSDFCDTICLYSQNTEGYNRLHSSANCHFKEGKGFMEKLNLAEYCIDLKTLSKDTIENRFEQLVNHYDEYKKYLCNKHTFMKSEAHKTTDILETVLERKEKAQ